MKLRIGHIIYSNCLPVHARFVHEGPPPAVRLIEGVPAELNRALAAGRIDLAPCSSIEYARNTDRYRVMPDFAIASAGPVHSILLESTRSPAALDGCTVTLPTASATSVVLLRLLLEKRAGIHPRYRSFDQRAEDPFDAGADAALWIGDYALHRAMRTEFTMLDLGEAWFDWTGLPFAYAVWQSAAPTNRDADLTAAHGLLDDSLAYFHDHDVAMAREYAGHYGLDADALLEYWHSLTYRLHDSVTEGLLRFYRLAAEIGEAPAAPTIRWLPRGS